MVVLGRNHSPTHSCLVLAAAVIRMQAQCLSFSTCNFAKETRVRRFSSNKGRFMRSELQEPNNRCMFIGLASENTSIIVPQDYLNRVARILLNQQ